MRQTGLGRRGRAARCRRGEVSPTRGGWLPRRGAKGAELGADPGRVRMVEVVQDREGRFPVGPGSGQIPGGVAGVAEVAESLGRAPVTADLEMQVESPLVAVDRFSVTPEMLVGVPEAVQRGGHPVLAADLAGQV